MLKSHSLIPSILLLGLSLFYIKASANNISPDSGPLPVAVIGLSHDHVHWILGRPDRGDIKIVGIVEPNQDLAKRFAKSYGFSMDLVYHTTEEMLAACSPKAVFVFTSIYQHLEVVEICAPLGIHVMVEKPLAVSVKHARKMQDLARKHGIHLLTNYETTWYPSNHKVFQMVQKNELGDLRKIVVHDGHRGPKEIGCSKEFLDWLTDPKLNGGGALTDFGCYGANLITWLAKGQKPISVSAVTQTIKPELYPKVDDEATIVLEYPKMQGIIQASWNWPISRKDMEVYGKTGYAISENNTDISYQLSENEQVKSLSLETPSAPYDDPFAMFAAVIKGDITLSPYDLSSLENNMIVVEILEAAKKSAKRGKSVRLK
ncbi:MAG: gfo/Idh/MocA family oxidoreductase [Bacteroidetes bacterium]|nr:MAG: gfo/Idh/MocA family oxidoreductase [Bacteroidota bacterium]